MRGAALAFGVLLAACGKEDAATSTVADTSSDRETEASAEGGDTLVTPEVGDTLVTPEVGDTLVTPEVGDTPLTEDVPGEVGPVVDTGLVVVDDSIVGADFYRGPARDRGPAIAFGTACKLYDTTPPKGDAGGDSGFFGFSSAGRIRVETPGAATTIDPGTTGVYFGPSLSPPLTGSEALTFHAAGAEVPAFDAALIAPKIVTMTAPATRTTVDTTVPLSVTWTAGSIGRVRVQVSAYPKELICNFEAGSGVGEIPREAIAALPRGTIHVFTRTETETSAVSGTFAITIRASFTTIVPDSAPKVGVIELTLP